LEFGINVSFSKDRQASRPDGPESDRKGIHNYHNLFITGVKPRLVPLFETCS